MSLLSGRKAYAPFKYPEAHNFWLQQQQAHWLATEVNLNSDLMDWKLNLSDAERSVIGGILKGFTQTEAVVQDYWSGKVAKWFPHPEIAMAAVTMGAMESVHLHAYSLLDQSLGFQDYEAYLQEPTVAAKLDSLVNTSGKTKEDKALSLAVFSAFTEGVNLFSSFAVLLSFARFNKMKGLSQIVSWSVRDEGLHSAFGCYLFRTFVGENPEILSDEFKQTVYEAARTAVALEDAFIDKVFEHGAIEGLDPHDIKQFVRMRANVKLGDLGFKQNWKNVDKESIARMSWFDHLTAGESSDDFFVGRVVNYSKFDNSEGMF